MQHRWDGSFGRGSVMNFLVRMREGSSVHLYRATGTREVPDRDHLGWLQKERGARFRVDTAGLGGRVPAGARLTRQEAADAFERVAPEYAVHDAQWQPGWRLGPVEKVTPELREWVRRLTEDPGSGANGVLERRKIDYWRGSIESWGFASAVLRALGYEDTPEAVLKELAPTVQGAFEVFKARRPDLEPW